jgi:hypothetical protein
MAYVPNIGFTNEASANVADPVGGLGGSPDFSAYNYIVNSAPGAMNSGDPVVGAPPDAGAVNDAGQLGGWWEIPASGMTHVFDQLGWSTNTNNQFYNKLTELAEGLKWASLLGQGPDAGMQNWLGTLNSWAGAGSNSGGGTGVGGYGNLGNILNTLVSGGGSNTITQGRVDQLSPQQIRDIFISLVGSMGFGNVSPDTIQSLTGIFNNLMTDFYGSGLLNTVGNEGVSSSDVFMDYIKQNIPDVLSYFNVPGF